MARGDVGFKHFESLNPDTLCEEIKEWVNGETDNISWVSEFHIVIKANAYHAFVKYVEEKVEE